MCVPLCLAFVLFAAKQPEAFQPVGDYSGGCSEQENATPPGNGMNDNLIDGDDLIGNDGSLTSECSGLDGSFSFSLTWGCYGVSSYDSKIGVLLNTTDATRPDDYITTYFLT